MSHNYLIVVGVDGSDGGRRALDWAVREAASRGGAVQAVIAWSVDDIAPRPLVTTSPTAERDRAAAILDEEISGVVQRHRSRLPVAGEVVEGSPAEALTAAASAADLLVLGSHGHSRVRHTVLGSVSDACIRRANCPVVVLPVPVSTPPAPAEPALRGR
ncbi:MAG TPA: universal stress protein [Pilimelia sp.]|nr:universal stress protein [Pilimelia sp.]